MSHEIELLYQQSYSVDPEEALLSPPDVFGVCCQFAKVTGCYRTYAESSARNTRRRVEAKEAGAAWRAALDAEEFPSVTKLPGGVREAWKRFGSATTLPIAKLIKSKSAIDAALFLIAAADEACVGIGIPAAHAGGYFEFFAEMAIRERDTLCRHVSGSSIRVLPKQHTPQSGFNIRSLSHHLALCSASEVRPIWTQMPAVTSESPAFNILLVPWPVEMDASDIRPARRVSRTSKHFGYFDYEPNRPVSDAKLVKWVVSVMDDATRIGQRVDMVILPECSLTSSQWEKVSNVAVQRNAIIISGVRGKATGGQGAENSLRIKSPLSEYVEIVQHKHHRWQLEEHQIANYGLGGTLCSKMSWWENIQVPPRELNFVAMRPDLVVCPLICEDLARQDPVAELVRSVGPNLVVALLMDGPQIPERWSARYASVLADDPGSSVLTLSSLGMVQLSRPQARSPSRVFASWKDATGNFVPLELGAGDSGVVLNVQFKNRQEWSVDGRDDGGVASIPVLCGVQPVRHARAA